MARFVNSFTVTCQTRSISMGECGGETGQMMESDRDPVPQHFCWGKIRSSPGRTSDHYKCMPFENWGEGNNLPDIVCVEWKRH